MMFRFYDALLSRGLHFYDILPLNVMNTVLCFKSLERILSLIENSGQYMKFNKGKLIKN